MGEPKTLYQRSKRMTVVSPIAQSDGHDAPRPVENLRQFLRQTYLSNRVFETYEDLLDAACEGWNRLVDQPWRIMSIGLRDWAHNGHSF